MEQGPKLVQSLRSELLAEGPALPMLSLPQRWFPPQEHILAFPLRYPHGQGGPGTTLALLKQQWWNSDMKLIGFGHIEAIHPDDFVTLLGRIKQTAHNNIRTLGQVVPAIHKAPQVLRVVL